MSKIDELRDKYPSVTSATFQRFVDGDKTKTKKYLAFMLKTWVNRTYQIKNSTDIVKFVNIFDELLPYIENKDIYHKEYEDISNLIKAIDDAMEEKEEKSFIREEHVHVLDENENYLLLQPKTHKGSLKYGRNTKWCTASKNNDKLFENYKKNGCLLYLIDKKGDKSESHEKVAFYLKDKFSLTGTVDVYNAKDSVITEENLISKGWSEDELIKIFMTVRIFAKKWNKIRTSISEIEKFKNTLNSLDFEKIKDSIKFIESVKDYSYITNAKETVEGFINQLQNIKI